MHFYTGLEEEILKMNKTEHTQELTAATENTNQERVVSKETTSEDHELTVNSSSPKVKITSLDQNERLKMEAKRLRYRDEEKDILSSKYRWIKTLKNSDNKEGQY